MEISEAKVLKSAAGYYIGSEYKDEEFDCWLPYDRYSEYFRTREEAEKYLPAYREIV